MEKYMPFIWIIIAVVMAVIEASTAQLVSIWFVLGAVCAAITSIFTESLLIQGAVFVAVSVVALIVTKPLAEKIRKKQKTTSTNADRVIGKLGIAVTDIPDDQSVGQVKVIGEVWSAVSKQPLKKGDKVKILGIEGVKLIVEGAE